MIRKLSITVLVVLVLATFTACSGGSDRVLDSDPPIEPNLDLGVAGGACFGNGSCYEGLACVEDVCVEDNNGEDGTEVELPDEDTDGLLELLEGWNGIPDNFRENSSDDAAKLDDEGKYGTYVETVTIPSTGSVVNPNIIGFQMSEDMVEVRAESKERDIILTVVYDGGGRKFYRCRLDHLYHHHHTNQR